MRREAWEALFSDEGRALLARSRHLSPEEFLFKQGSTIPTDLRSALVEQLRCAPFLHTKLPTFFYASCFAEKALLEQATPEPVARFKASLLSGQSCGELTGGMGADTLFLAPQFSHYDWCEIDEGRVTLFAQNRTLLGLDSVVIHQGDSLSCIKDQPRYTWLYADPARRDGERKGSISLEHCQPALLPHLSLLKEKCDNLALKLSPAYDVSQLQREIPWVHTVYVLSYKREVKELLALASWQEKVVSPRVIAVSVDERGVPLYQFERQADCTPDTPSTTVGPYLYDPEAVIIKADAVGAVVRHFGLQRYHARSVFAFGHEVFADFPGRILQIIALIPWQRKEVQRYLTLHNLSQATVIRRDFPLSVEELRKRFHLHDSSEVFLYFVSNGHGGHVVIHAERC